MVLDLSVKSHVPGYHVILVPWLMRCFCSVCSIKSCLIRQAWALPKAAVMLLADLWPLLWQELRRHPGGHGEHLVRRAPAAVLEGASIHGLRVLPTEPGRASCML